MWKQSALLLLAACSLTVAQRGSYAGRRPIGYPVITTTTTPAPLSDRFGEDSNSTTSPTTIRLPAEALGDRELFDRLNKLPDDKKPFWLLNWQALEANRNRPQSYTPNENSFVDKFSSANSQTNNQANGQFNTIASRFRSNDKNQDTSGNSNSNQRSVRVRDTEANRASRELNWTTWRKQVAK